jgi:hypothetical protein
MASLDTTILIADAGIPMLAWQFPLAVALFVPVVVVESVIAWLILREPLWPVASRICFANAVSTFVGIPMAWVFMVLTEGIIGGGRFTGYGSPWATFQSVVLSAPWLPPDDIQLRWLVPAATLVLLVPYFFVSLAVERWMMLMRWRNLPRSRVFSAAWIGNVVTYCGLATWASYLLYRGVRAHTATGPWPI